VALRVLCIDDDVRLYELLSAFLEPNGVALVHAADGPKGLAALGADVFDAVLLDVMMPGMDGLTVCRRIREQSRVPIIMLTARGDEADRVVGLELGADDYVVKPFNPRELLARIHAVLRRRPEPPAKPKGDPRFLAFGPFELNLDTRALTRDGKLVALTAAEYSLLRALATHPGEPLSRERLSQLARGRELDESARSLDVQVSRLRKLLGDDAHRPRLIQTVWGYGYAFVPDGQPIR